MILWPKKSSDSLFSRCFTLDLMSSSSSQTRTLILSEELWHSLTKNKRWGKKKVVLIFKEKVKQFLKKWEKKSLDLQVELFFPNRVKVPINSFGSLLSLANLNSHIWITGSGLVFCLKSLRTNNWNSDKTQMHIEWLWTLATFYKTVQGIRTRKKNEVCFFKNCIRFDQWNTCDGDLCWPLRGTIQHALFDSLHLLSMNGFTDVEHFSDQLKYLWFIPFPDFHSVLHGHDNILCAIFSSMLRAFFRGT